MNCLKNGTNVLPLQPEIRPRNLSVDAVGLGTIVQETEQRKNAEWRHQQSSHLEEQQTAAYVQKDG